MSGSKQQRGAIFYHAGDVRASSVSPGLQETGLREGVVVAGVGVVAEGEVWAAGRASTPAASVTSTDTAAATNREWLE